MNLASRQQPSSGVAERTALPGRPHESHTVPARPQSPQATRSRDRTWRDPRLAVGVAIVAVCVLVGGRLLSAADDTVAVWSVRTDLPTGSTVTASDLVPSRVRFGSGALAGRYLSAEDRVPSGLVLTRDVTAGELLPRAALARDVEAQQLEVPVAVPAEAVPATLRAGELVDVWVTPETQAGPATRATRVLERVRVVAVPSSGGALGPAVTRQVLVGLSVDEQGRLSSALAKMSAGTPLLVRRD